MQRDHKKQLQKIRNYVDELFQDDVSGHDYFHMQRVAMMAKSIAQRENADGFTCEAAGLLHDVGDDKLFIEPKMALAELDVFLNKIELTKWEIDQIRLAIKDVSFSKGGRPTTLEGKIVQDADRLDALGAIGIARTFAFGGFNGQMIHHDTVHKNTTIQHFYDKLLGLKDTMNTKSAEKLANERHLFMQHYLEQFFKEWQTHV